MSTKPSPASHTRQILLLQGRYDETGGVPTDTLAALEATRPGRLTGIHALRRCLMLGLVPQARPVALALKSLAGAWVYSDLTLDERQRVRRQASRYLLVAGCAEEARQLMLEGRSTVRPSSAASDLADEALLLQLRCEIGSEHGVAEDVLRILRDPAGTLARLPYAETMWTLSEIAQVLLSVYLRSIDAAVGLGMRLPDLHCDRTALHAALQRWTELAGPDGRTSAHPEHRALHLLVRTAAGAGPAEDRVAAQRETQDPAGGAALRTAETWLWLGTACRLRSQVDAAKACFAHALQLANHTGSVRAKVLGQAEIARIAQREGDIARAYLALEVLRSEERRLQARSPLPLGRSWREQLGGEVELLPSGASHERAAAMHVDRARAIIHGDPRFDLGTEDLARGCGVSCRTLEVAFKECLGESVRSHVSRLRIERVIFRLVHGGETIKAVARACGYPNTAALSREFSRNTGKSLTRFLRESAG